MKKDYTEDEYRSLAAMAEEEQPETEKHAVSKEEYSRRKKAMAEGKEESNRALSVTLIAVAAFFVLCIIVSGISVAIKNSRAKKDAEAKEQTAITIAGDELGADLFKLFCVNVIEGSDFEYLMKTAINDSALENSVKEKAVKYAEEYVCLYKEAVAAGLELTEAEVAETETLCKNTAEAAGKDVEQYYRENYGVSFDTYVNMQKNWRLADKYVQKLRGECDLSEEALLKVYNAHYEKFAKADVTMVYFDTSSSDSGKNGFVKSTAESIFNDLKVEAAGGAFAADETKLLAAVIAQEDVNKFYTVGEKADGKATVTGTDAINYPKLYQAVITMGVGEARLIHDDTATFIVRCDKQYFFEACKDSEELKEYAQELYIKEKYNSARYSGNYTAEIGASYRSIDIKRYIAEGKKHYGR